MVVAPDKEPTMTKTDTTTSQPRAPREHSKTDRLLSLLQSGAGACLDDMMEATGWQAHTVRAALTGLRKRGYDVERYVEGTMTCWRIAKSAA